MEHLSVAMHNTCMLNVTSALLQSNCYFWKMQSKIMKDGAAVMLEDL